MENLIIQGSQVVPTIDFDHKSGLLKISGRLISVSSQENPFFVPIIEWLEKYASNPAKQTRLNVDLEFCSSAGIKNMFQLFKVLEQMHIDGYDVAVIWKYYNDDEDSRDKGHNFNQLLKLPFEVKLHSRR